MNKSMTLISTLVLAMAAATPALAEKGERGWQGKGHHHHQHHERRLERMASKLDLSDEQRQQLTAIREEHGPQLRELRGEIREARKALREQAGPQFDEGTARSQAEKLGRLSGEAALLTTRMHAQSQAVLTEEQRAKMAEMREKRKQRMKERGKERRSERRERHSH